MKSFIAAALLLTSTASFAGYEPIHDYMQVLGQIKLKNACVTDSEVRSINPQTVCTELEARTTNHGGEIGSVTDWVCVNWETMDLSAPRAFERTVCLRNAPVTEASHGECLEWGTKDDFLPKTIKVIKVYPQGETTREVRTTHTFPACE